MNGKPRHRMIGVAALCLLAVAAPVRADPAAAATAPSAGEVSDADIASLLKVRVDQQRRATGVVVGVLRPSGKSLVVYGADDGPAGRRLGGDTIFEIASLTKVFTALLLADLAQRGEAGLDDQFTDYSPAEAAVPSFEGHAITLADLATHGAGLPLRPANLHVLADAPNKYAGYTLDQLWAGLADITLTRAPGTKFEYSNLSFALLGQGLAQKAGSPYAELLRARITAPLGLADTRLTIDPAAKARTARGHDIDLKPVGPSDEGALAPAGGLRSTANDLMKFMALFLDEKRQGELADAARLMLSVDRPGEDANTRMALGWRRTTIDGETFYWSNGSGDGSRAFMGFNPARQIAVVALANAASGGGLDDIGRHVLDPAQPVDLKIPAVHHEVKLAPAALERVLGTYEFAPGDRFTITRGATGLIITVGAGQQLVVYPESPTRFFAKLADFTLDFAAGEGPPDVVVLQQDGQPSTYKRVP